MIPDSRHFTGLAPANIWKLAMLGRYAVNAIASSNVWVVQVAIAFNRPGPALNLDVSKIRTPCHRYSQDWRGSTAASVLVSKAFISCCMRYRCVELMVVRTISLTTRWVKA